MNFYSRIFDSMICISLAPNPGPCSNQNYLIDVKMLHLTFDAPVFLASLLNITHLFI